MSSTLSHDFASESRKKGQWFHAEASEVLTSLRSRVAEVLSELGDFTRPAEVQRALRLDKTLSRQVFKLACTAEAMASGNVVPSRTSICRFLDVAKERGLEAGKLEGVLVAYEQFEKLVRTHAGDRVTFNSMVSAASGVDDDWLATDLQHRRNGFRTMSHAIGVQIKTRLHLSVITGKGDGSIDEFAAISGCIGLRVLRPMPSVRVDGVALSAIHGAGIVSWEPMGITESAKGHLLEPFCSKPLPKLKVAEGETPAGKWRQIAIEEPEVGNLGSTTLIFGSICRKIPADGEPLSVFSTTGKPTEVLLFDVLIDPSISPGIKPKGSAVLGLNDRHGSEVLPLEGKFEPELLGRGPSALATPEVPHYSDMLNAVADKLGCNLSGFNAWRLRAEYPLYQSTMIMAWQPPKK